MSALSGPAVAGVIGRDTRVPLAALERSDAAPDRRLAEAARASGLITCDNGRFASASLVAADDVIVTSAHVFFGELDKIRAGGVRCLFLPGGRAEGPRYEVDMASLKLGAERVTGVNICSNGRDWAVLRLRTPAAGIRPYPIAGSVAVPGTPLALVSHGGGTGALAGPGGHAGRCTLRDLVGPCRETGVPLLFTDCSAEAGSSGGATLVEENGRWAIAGVTRGASPAGGDYDRTRVYHMAVPATGTFAETIRRMAH